jgi:FKBP-type peptidyl-prolyl cis-trans isomerase 2
VLKTLDESLATMEINKAQSVEIPPEKGFGPRDPEKIKRVPLKQLLAKDINPAIGARIEYGGKNATIRSIGAGRVLLDFNPPLAGKTLVYDVTVQKKLETNEEKIAALIHRRIPVAEADKFKLVLEEKILIVEMPEDTYYLEGIQVAKRGVAMDIQKFFSDINTVKFIEAFKRQKPATTLAEKPSEEKTAETEAAKAETTEATAETKTTETATETKPPEVVEEKPAEK